MAQIIRLDEAGSLHHRQAEIEAIFFASAARQSFASAADRDAYLDLWLGRYLRHFPESCFIAVDEAGAVAGYLAGALISDRDPLPGPDYFALFPRPLIEAHPAHLHVNVRADLRGQGVGSDLIAAFRAHCLGLQVPGLHAVTTATSRAAQFFMQCGLAERAEADWRGRRIVFLGETLV